MLFDCFKKKKKVVKVKDLPIESKKEEVHSDPVPNSNTYPKEYLREALRVTGGFEGSGYGQVSGNFDGQGLSVGILQWNYGQGSLQNKILKPIIDKKGKKAVDAFFPSPISQSASMSRKQGIAFSKRMQTKKWSWRRKAFIYSMKPEWKSAWRKFLTSFEGRDQQLLAADTVASKVWSYAQLYSMNSIKSFCWFFDVVTQNGSLKGIPKPIDLEEYDRYILRDGGINRKKWQRLRVDNETKILFIWICQRVTRNKWASDVISRKGTIAHAQGRVHGKNYNLLEAFK